MKNTTTRLRLNGQVRKELNTPKRYPRKRYRILTQTRLVKYVTTYHYIKFPSKGTTDTWHCVFKAGYLPHEPFSFYRLAARVIFNSGQLHITYQPRTTTYEAGDGDSETCYVLWKYIQSPLSKLKQHRTLYSSRDMRCWRKTTTNSTTKRVAVAHRLVSTIQTNTFNWVSVVVSISCPRLPGCTKAMACVMYWP